MIKIDSQKDNWDFFDCLKIILMKLICKRKTSFVLILIKKSYLFLIKIFSPYSSVFQPKPLLKSNNGKEIHNQARNHEIVCREVGFYISQIDQQYYKQTRMQFGIKEKRSNTPNNMTGLRLVLLRSYTIMGFIHILSKNFYFLLVLQKPRISADKDICRRDFF